MTKNDRTFIYGNYGQVVNEVVVDSSPSPGMYGLAWVIAKILGPKKSK